MSELSPQAQAVMDSVAKAMECPDGFLPYELELMAAALRAAADQVVPPALEEEFFSRNHALSLQKKVEIRLKLIDIANELENHQ